MSYNQCYNSKFKQMAELCNNSNKNKLINQLAYEHVLLFPSETHLSVSCEQIYSFCGILCTCCERLK